MGFSSKALTKEELEIYFDRTISRGPDMMADELEQFADQLEKAKDFTSEMQTLIRKTFSEHQRIIFNGNGYDDAWIKEAEKRGLSNLTSTADALPAYTAKKNVALFTKHGNVNQNPAHSLIFSGRHRALPPWQRSSVLFDTVKKLRLTELHTFFTL